jgi:phosphoribosylformylglycinamidine synthase
VILFVAPRSRFAIASRRLTADLREEGLLHSGEEVRLLRRYAVAGGGASRIDGAIPTVFADPAEERVLAAPEELFDGVDPTGMVDAPTILTLGYRYHAGQFDQRADAAEQALRILGIEDVTVEVAEVAVFRLRSAPEEVVAARRAEFVARLVNPVDSEVVTEIHGQPGIGGTGGPGASGGAAAAAPKEAPNGPPGVSGITLADTQLNDADREFVAAYFAREGREPTETELAVIDTYWSDHCRHTTFRTELEGLELAPPEADGRAVDADAVAGAATRPGEEGARTVPALREAIAEIRDWYLSERQRRGESGRPITLMDLATAMMRWRRADGELPDVVFSAEINACTLRVTDGIPGLAGTVNPEEPWLVLFKNETHNHPTEIEPFGGAATCLGGAIRDPLSGRAYVYQAMRVTGAADPRRPGPRSAAEAGESLAARDTGAGPAPGGDPAGSAAAGAPAVGTPTLPGKLPQRLITTGAAHGYSSYGNQIGIATGLVDEVYHPGYRAKRLEMGAVVGAVPESFVRREEPTPGDLVLLIGGRTGRDGIGGATGSSRSHSRTSIESAGAEVQKGNPPVERALQRLFRRREFTALVKRSNDFGAGGVAVAVGEIADGLEIDLAAVPLKYRGLTPREIAISESQERMAVVVAAEEREAAMALAAAENLEASVIARVTDAARLVMRFGETTVADISREFLDTAGVRGRAGISVTVGTPGQPVPRGTPASDTPSSVPGRRSDPGTRPGGASLLAAVESRLGDLRHASRLSLGEWFDSSIGAGTLLAHAGGRLQRSPMTAMAARLPHVFSRQDPGGTEESVVSPEVATVMAYGFDPDLSAASPWRGAYTAIVESLARLAAAGIAPGAAWLSLQEFFPRPGDDPERWGLPVAALLGALAAQRDLGVTAIGGKDSMSGSFEAIDVPPTLISVALGVMRADRVVSAHMIEADRPVYLIPVPMTAAGVPDARVFQEHHRRLAEAVSGGDVLAAAPVRGAGWLPALVGMCFGDNLGFELAYRDGALDPAYGSVIVQLKKAPPPEWGAIHLGETTADGAIVDGEERRRTADLFRSWSQPLEEVFPSKADPAGPTAAAPVGGSSDPAAPAGGSNFPPAPAVPAAPAGEKPADSAEATALLVERRGRRRVSRPSGWARPGVAIPVFPGSNCEDDTAAAFADAGARPRQIVLRTLTRGSLDESLNDLARALEDAQILAIPGGFSAGDEPAGSGKYIAAVLRAPVIREVIEERFVDGDRLILGICNGFQALVRTGLVPFGRFVERRPGWPSLAPNTIGRHVSRSVLTRIDSDLGPWMAGNSPGDLASVPVSHGEGRLLCDPAILADLATAGQVAARYVDWQGRTRLDRPWNPNGSDDAVEALLSPDGRFLGKMGHTERERPGLNRHLPGVGRFDLFASGVGWFA